MTSRKRQKTFIREWRKHRKLTQEQLAAKLDMSSSNLSMLERGLQDYTQKTLESLADALNCETIELLARDPSDPKGIWAIWESLDESQREQAVDLLEVLQRRKGRSRDGEKAA